MPVVSMVAKLVLMDNIGAKVLPNDTGSDNLGKYLWTSLEGFFCVLIDGPAPS